jgi:sulfur-carrier protein
VTTVRIPPVLRAQVGNVKQLEVSGASVGEVIDQLVGQHPRLREHLLADDGALHRFVNIYLNGQDVRYLGELDTPVGERDTLILLPAMAGGA